MAEFINQLFSSAPGLERVNIIGLIVMVFAVLVLIFAGRLALLLPDAKREGGKLILKVASLLICMAGFAIAVF